MRIVAIYLIASGVLFCWWALASIVGTAHYGSLLKDTFRSELSRAAGDEGRKVWLNRAVADFENQTREIEDRAWNSSLALGLSGLLQLVMGVATLALRNKTAPNKAVDPTPGTAPRKLGASSDG